MRARRCCHPCHYHSNSRAAGGEGAEARRSRIAGTPYKGAQSRGSKGAATIAARPTSHGRGHSARVARRIPAHGRPRASGATRAARATGECSSAGRPPTCPRLSSAAEAPPPRSGRSSSATLSNSAKPPATSRRRPDPGAPALASFYLTSNLSSRLYSQFCVPFRFLASARSLPTPIFYRAQLLVAHVLFHFGVEEG